MATYERRNINRGYRKLRVWQDAVSLYSYVCKVLEPFPFELKKTAGNAIDAAMAIQRNIAEGYSRRSIHEYLNFLNYSLGSCGELFTSFYSFRDAGQITEDEFEDFDKLHFKTENQLIKLIESLQKKKSDGDWSDIL